MKKHIQSAITVLIILLGHVSAQSAEVFFEDNFDYTGWETGSKQMKDVWKRYQTLPRVISSGELSSKSYVSVDDGSISVPFDKALTEDFVLTVNILSSDYCKYHWFGVTNGESTQGYYVAWDTALETQCGSAGWVAIGKIECASTKRLGCVNPGTYLTKCVPSGHNRTNKTTAAIAPPFAEFTLRWIQKESTLILEVDSKEKLRIKDESFSNFSRLYIAGNKSLFIESIKLATPEINH